VSCDGQVLSTDASLILQYTTGIISNVSCDENGDVNGDARIDSIDALLVLQYVAGLLPAL
jgi:hypothetical protein